MSDMARLHCLILGHTWGRKSRLWYNVCTRCGAMKNKNVEASS